MNWLARAPRLHQDEGHADGAADCNHVHGDPEQERGGRDCSQQVREAMCARDSGRSWSTLTEWCVVILGNSLVIGTESRQVLVLDPAGSSIMAKVTLPGVPVHMAITGLFDVDYRIVVACRDGNVYTVKV